MMVASHLAVALLALSVASDAASVTIGDVRVSALSESLVRVERKGPTGFEDRSTMNVVGREKFAGLAIRTLNASASGTWLATGAYHIFVPTYTPPGPPPVACGTGGMESGTDAASPHRSPSYPNGANAESPGACCALCEADAQCQVWVSAAGSPDDANGNAHINCWPLASSGSTQAKLNRTFGRVRGTGGAPSGLDKGVIVTTPAGKVLYSGANTGNGSQVAANLLHWPSPLDSTAYAFNDYPRFTVPEWGPTPIPSGAKVAPHTVATNGYGEQASPPPSPSPPPL
jgi:hypothetical protein